MNLNKTLFYLTVLNQNNNINKEKNLKIFLNPTDITQKYFSEISEETILINSKIYICSENDFYKLNIKETLSK